MSTLQQEALDEIRLMKRGDNSDWESWSPETRKGWALAMLGIIREDGLEIPARLLAWLKAI